MVIYDIKLYQRESGRVPVEEFLHSLDAKLRAKAFLDIELLEKHGNDLHEPYVKPVKGKQNKGLYELRIKFAGDIARIFIKGGMNMSKASISFRNIKPELMQDPEFRAEYERLQPRYAIISQIIEARKEQNVSQSELARRIGTQKSNISRLESGTYNPSLDFLIKVANGLGKEIRITMK